MRALPGRFGLNVGLTALFLSACAPPPPDAATDDLTTIQSEIVNGTNLTQYDTQTWGTVAVYHPPKGGGAGWSARPCSGIILQTAPTATVILTARHCVTVDGLQQSAIAPASRIKVMPGRAPGLGSATTPAGAVTASGVSAAPNDGGPVAGWDQALIWIPANFGPMVGIKYGVWVSAASHLKDVAQQFVAFGYGISSADSNCSSNGTTVGAGTARIGAPFTVTLGTGAPAPPATGGNISFNNHVLPSGPRIFCGDSGGPDVASLGASQGSVWQHIIGVNSLGAGESADAGIPSQWLQASIGGLYLSPDSNRNFNFHMNTSFVASLVTKPTQSTPMRYDPHTQRVWVATLGVNGRCLSTAGTPGASVGMQPCQDVAGQRWEIKADRRIRHVSSQLCLTASGTNLVTNFCAGSLPQSATQFWAFHPQQYDLETYTFCSNENGQCAFSGTKSIRYGANGSYVYRVLTNGTPCNNATFGDPIPGVPKQCAIGPAGFNHCANQGGQCSFTGTKVVAYGARSSFYYKPFTNGVTCDVGPFGGDPLVGVVKACYVANGQ